ncbi:MAG: 4Fe-4S binding protein [Firmicutes bacterium]|nr:4Fe-4S binding protein [Bacillota bacterium]
MNVNKDIKFTKVTIREDLCKSCGLCIKECPKSLLQVKEGCVNQLGYQPVFMPAEKEVQCTSCARCAEVCPDTLIEVYR